MESNVKVDRAIRQYLQKIGRKGGKTRAARYGTETLRYWARLGGKAAARAATEQAEARERGTGSNSL